MLIRSCKADLQKLALLINLQILVATEEPLNKFYATRTIETVRAGARGDVPDAGLRGRQNERSTSSYVIAGWCIARHTTILWSA
jgi:hypothetical protein